MAHAFAIEALREHANLEYEASLERQLLFYYLLEPLRPRPQQPTNSNTNNNASNINNPATATALNDGMVYSRPNSPTNNTSTNTNTNNAPKRLTRAQELDRAEKEIEARKLQIQRFGATWIKPPGITKTYQMFLDEEAEREEEEMEVDGEDGEGGDEVGEDSWVPGEVDLDADVPEGEDMLSEGEEDEEEEEEEGMVTATEGDLTLGTHDGDMTLPEGEYSGEEVDLDAEVPDAEEYDLDADVPDADETRGWGSSEEEEHEGSDEEEHQFSEDEEEEDEDDRSPDQSREYPEPRHRLPTQTPQRLPRTPRTPHNLPRQTPQTRTYSDEGLSDLEASSPIPMRSSPIPPTRTPRRAPTQQVTPTNFTPAQAHPPRTPGRPENSRATATPASRAPPRAPPPIRHRLRYQGSSPMPPSRAERATSRLQTPEQGLRRGMEAQGRTRAAASVRGTNVGVPGAGRTGNFLMGRRLGSGRVSSGISSGSELDEEDSMEVDIEDSMNRGR